MIKLRTTVATIAAMALTASLAAATMATDETEPPVVGDFSIEGMDWVLTEQLVDGVLTPVPDGVAVSLRMEDGRAGGSGGCNRYFTTYEMDGHDVSLGPIGSTMMACSGPADTVESSYFANLANVAAYQSGGIQMAFLDADGDPILAFDFVADATIVGSWIAQGINDQMGENAGVVAQGITQLVSAEFSAAGALSGSDGCNEYFTTYETDGADISVAPEIATTMMMCPDEVMEQARWYQAALTNAATWSIDPATGVLELRDADGAVQVRYVPAES